MNVAIVGSRDWPWPKEVKNAVLALSTDDVVVSGGAHGVDTFAENAAKARSLETIVLKPDWDNLGKRAGFLRNIDIVNLADRMIAFQYKQSKGTQHSINLAKKKGIPIRLISYTEEHGMQVTAL